MMDRVIPFRGEGNERHQVIDILLRHFQEASPLESVHNSSNRVYKAKWSQAG
jgi:hypothetical protein